MLNYRNPDPEIQKLYKDQNIYKYKNADKGFYTIPKKTRGNHIQLNRAETALFSGEGDIRQSVDATSIQEGLVLGDLLDKPVRFNYEGTESEGMAIDTRGLIDDVQSLPIYMNERANEDDYVGALLNTPINNVGALIFSPSAKTQGQEAMRAVARGDMTLKILTDSKNGGQPVALSLTKKLDTRKESRKMDAIDIPFVMPDEQREFSVGRAIRAEVSGDWSQAGYEREMCQEAKRNYAGTAKGLVIPESAIYQQRAVMTSTGDVSGAIGTQLLGGRYVDIPRQKSSVMEAGATTLTGLQSNVAIPKLSSDTSATFVAENSAISDDDLDVDQISMSPRLCAGTASFTRTVLETSNPRIDTLVRTGLELQIMNRIDSSALTGDGSGANPTGITATSGINTKATTGSSTMTHAEALEVIAAVAANNIDTAGGAWIVHPNDAAVIGATSKDSGSGTFVYENGSIGGKRVIESTHAPEGTAFFGVFEHLYIGFFGGLDLVIDPYSSARNGVIEITASQLVDVAVAHNKAFNKVTLTA